jgi:hypothetical protein
VAVRTLPDAEQLVVQALLSLPDLAALDGRIYANLPKSRTFPLARVARFGGDPMWPEGPYWVDVPTFQVDVWAEGGFVEAWTLAETLRACMATELVGEWPTGVILSSKVAGLVASADSDFDPPKPRYRFVATIRMHP